MSLYVKWVNTIKAMATEAWLTDRQREVFDALLTRWGSHSFVNLYGAQGSGKTFLAHLLAKGHDYAFAQDLADAPPGSPQVVLDDAQYDRMLRPLARDLCLGRVILITEAPVRETMPRIELALGIHDVHQFCVNLSERCGIGLIHTLPEGLDLGEILRRELVARGEAHVTG